MARNRTDSGLLYERLAGLDVVLEPFQVISERREVSQNVVRALGPGEIEPDFVQRRAHQGSLLVISRRQVIEIAIIHLKSGRDTVL